MRKNIVGFVSATFFLISACLAEAQQAIYLVRHGETVAPKGTDAVRYRKLGSGGPRCLLQC